MKEFVTKVIDTLTQEDFDMTFQKLLERFKKWIAAGGDYFEWDKSFMCVLSIKVPTQKKSRNLFKDPRVYIYIYISNIQSASEDYGCGLFVYRVYERFHINIWETNIFVEINPQWQFNCRWVFF